MILEHLRCVVGGAEGRLHDIHRAQHAHAAAPRDLTACIRFGQIGLGSGNRHRGQRGRACAGLAVEHIAAAGLLHGLQASAGQQRVQAAAGRVAALQAVTVPALGELGAERQRDAGFAAVAAQHIAQRAAGNVIGAGLRLGVGGSRSQQDGNGDESGREGSLQRRGEERAPQGGGEGA
ncbi:hypothetical protein D3C87_1316790 [compost metagenome]